jgi:O-succinylbenzoic acid--CoA ligase
VSSRPLHAVLLPPAQGGGRLTELLAAALDGTGPAILPLDPAVPPARLRDLITALRPASVEDASGAGLGTPHRAPAAGVAAGTAVVVATSGSTGPPKGVQLSAAALRASAAASLTRVGAVPAGAGPAGRWLCCLPGFHVAGLQVLVRSLLAGTEPVVTDRVDARTVAGCGCAYVSLVPTQLRRLLDAGAPLGLFEAILLGGAAPPAGLLAEARAAGARVITTYGMSETCGGCVYDGLPLDGVRLRTGADGRIGIAGPVLFSGYWPPAAVPAGSSAAGPAAAGDGWFWTSDIGALDDAGRLTVRGRADDVINTGGEKVLPGEVESVVGTLDGVRDVVIVGVPDSEWGEMVTAVIVPENPAVPPELARLRAQARERLPGYAAPRRLILVAEIPMLASGKPDRQALRGIAGPGGVHK